jgi:ferredoxin
MRGSQRLVVNPIACDGHGICAELLPELIELDDWGYPIISSQPVPVHLESLARRAISACPTLALRMAEAEAAVTTARAGRRVH